MSAELSHGTFLKERALNLLEAFHEDRIITAQRALLKRLLTHGYATIDDARDSLDIPKGTTPHWLGSVHRALEHDQIIARVGRLPSKRPEAHARKQDLWALMDRAKALEWQARHPEGEAPPGMQWELPFNEEPGRGNARANG